MMPAMSVSLNAFPTVDQEEPTARAGALPPEAFLEVLCHGHMARWGEITPPGTMPPDRTLRVGRGTPLIPPWAPRTVAPLADPAPA